VDRRELQHTETERRPRGYQVESQSRLQFHDGKKVPAPTLALTVSALRRQFPTMTVEGWVVIHSPAGDSENRP
jgi:hypothetical protein